MPGTCTHTEYVSCCILPHLPTRVCCVCARTHLAIVNHEVEVEGQNRHKVDNIQWLLDELAHVGRAENAQQKLNSKHNHADL